MKRIEKLYLDEEHMPTRLDYSMKINELVDAVNEMSSHQHLVNGYVTEPPKTPEPRKDKKYSDYDECINCGCMFVAHPVKTCKGFEPAENEPDFEERHTSVCECHICSHKNWTPEHKPNHVWDKIKNEWVDRG